MYIVLYQLRYSHFSRLSSFPHTADKYMYIYTMYMAVNMRERLDVHSILEAIPVKTTINVKHMYCNHTEQSRMACSAGL